MPVKLIQSLTVASTTTTIDFQSIPQTYDGLMLYIDVRGTSGQTGTAVIGRFNDDSGNNYGMYYIQGNGISAGSAALTSQSRMFIGQAGFAAYTANSFGNTRAFIYNYRSSAQKTVIFSGVQGNNSTSAYQSYGGAYWTGTSAINRITFTTNPATNFAVGSTIQLYGF